MEVGHDLLPVEEMQSRIDDHRNDDPVEKGPQYRQAQNYKEDRDGGSLDYGFRAISHLAPTGSQSHYDCKGVRQSWSGWALDRVIPSLSAAIAHFLHTTTWVIADGPALATNL